MSAIPEGNKIGFKQRSKTTTVHITPMNGKLTLQEWFLHNRFFTISLLFFKSVWVSIIKAEQKCVQPGQWKGNIRIVMHTSYSITVSFHFRQQQKKQYNKFVWYSKVCFSETKQDIKYKQTNVDIYNLWYFVHVLNRS